MLQRHVAPLNSRPTPNFTFIGTTCMGVLYLSKC